MTLDELPPRVATIVRACADAYDVPAAWVPGGRNRGATVRARDLAVLVLRDRTSLTYQEIGDLLHRDAGTLYLARCRAEERIAASGAGALRHREALAALDADGDGA